MVGNRRVRESELEFAPRWITDQAISREKANYDGCYMETPARQLPRNANIISSHHLFEVKNDGASEKLKLKCRLVLHGNKDVDRDWIRKDSMTAQFPVIRIVLSISVFMNFGIVTLDVNKAYFQSRDLQRDAFVRPPRSWSAKPGMYWKLIKPAYGLPDSGRVRQLTIEKWIQARHLIQVHGLTQLFLRLKTVGGIHLVLAKLVDDFFIAGECEAIQAFVDDISQSFSMGRLSSSSDSSPTLIFNRFEITPFPTGSIQIDVQEYLDAIQELSISRQRRMQHEEPSAPAELTPFLALAGTLNFLGHGALSPAS